MQPAKYAATADSIAASSSSLAVFWLKVLQSRPTSASAPGVPASETSLVRISRLGIRALPPRRPNDTKPSSVGQISRVRPMLAPRRLPRAPVSAKPATATMFATSTTSCIDTSTRCGKPVASAVIAANAASGPECAYAVGSVHRIGARSGSPVVYMFPDAAIAPRSDTSQPARGPSLPSGEIRTHTASGARAGSTRERSGESDLVDHDVGAGEQLVERGVVGGERDHLLARVPGAGRRCVGNGSPAGGTTRTTSAPRSPSTRAARAPVSPPRSSTRKPSSRRCVMASLPRET